MGDKRSNNGVVDNILLSLSILTAIIPGELG